MRLFRRLLVPILVLAVIGGAAGWILTAPRPLAAAVLPAGPGDVAKGRVLFWAGGCFSCHAAEGATPSDKPELGGGKPFVTPVGTFYPPNISPDPETGIGRWSTIDFVNAMKLGLAPDGSHLYPAFPYTSYQRIPIADLVDLKAFLDQLPAVRSPNKPHDLAFPLSIRRGLGLWKLVFLDGKTFEPDPSKSAEVNRGAFLVEGPGHCNECHTPRSFFGVGPLAFLGGLDYAHELGGAPNPTRKGARTPNITPGNKDLIGDAPVDDIVTNFETPDKFSHEMAEVQANLLNLPVSDVQAIVVYLKQLPPLASPPRTK